MINNIISSFINLILFCSIPFVAYILNRKKYSGFFDYIGIAPCSKKNIVIAFMLGLVLTIIPIALCHWKVLDYQVLQITLNN